MKTTNAIAPSDLAEHEALRAQVRHIWLDFQQMTDFERDPIIVSGGKGLRVQTTDGREFIDAIGGAMVSTLGYGDEGIRQAMHAAIDRQDFWPMLHSTTPAALRLAARLAELLPDALNTTFFVCGGSEATETAMKMARQFHRNAGRSTRYKVISRYSSYHGATLGAMAASGLKDRVSFEPLPLGFNHVPPPFCYRCPWGKRPESCNVECADAVGAAIHDEGRETVAAIIVDPIMAGAGVLVPPKAYYRRLREIADRTGVLLIFDEVLTGFGRTGYMFAADYYEVTPDLICLGKGITAGYAPLAAVVVSDVIAEAFRGGSDRTFLHGHTYGGYPLGCEAALAVIAKLVDEGIVARAAEQGAYLGERLIELAKRHCEVGDVRGVGMLWGIEFVANRETRAPFPSARAFAPLVRRKALELGLITRGSVNVLILAPALTASRDDIDEIMTLVEQSIDLARKELAS